MTTATPSGDCVGVYHQVPATYTEHTRSEP